MITGAGSHRRRSFLIPVPLAQSCLSWLGGHREGCIAFALSGEGGNLSPLLARGLKSSSGDRPGWDSSTLYDRHDSLWLQVGQSSRRDTLIRTGHRTRLSHKVRDRNKAPIR